SRKPKNPWIVSSSAEKPVRACPTTLSKLKRRHGRSKAPETLSGLLRRMAPCGRHAAEVRSRRILSDVEDVAADGACAREQVEQSVAVAAPDRLLKRRQVLGETA